MIVLKFGGTSMGSAERIVNSASIICGRADTDRTGVVVSAVAGVSNRLQESLDRCLAGKDPEFFVDSLTTIHTSIAQNLASLIAGFDLESVLQKQQLILVEFGRLIRAVASFGECPDSVHCRVMGMGEMLSLPMIAEVIRAKGYTVTVLDSRNFIKTSGSLLEGDPVYDMINDAFAPYIQTGPQVLLMTGFVSASIDGHTSLLGRNGSDFSAALMAMGLKAKKLEIWTDVDGIYTADPRIVPEAVLVDEMSYAEAMELSFFGSKVLHPKTITPIAANQIETWSLNSFNPTAKGTRIAAGPFKQTGPVRGISCLKNVSVITVSGSGMKGKPGMAARIFSAVSRRGVSVLMITQSSSEYTVSFCVRDSETVKTKEALEEEFALEQREQLIDPLAIMCGRSIISIVGDGMKAYRGLAATFFKSLASGNINIFAIAQGSSERSISAVISGEDGDKAVKQAHRFFFNNAQSAEIFLVGIGTVGTRLLDEIRLHQNEIRQDHITIRVCGIANSQKMLLSKDGINLSSWKEQLATSDVPSSIDAILDFVSSEKPLNPVFVDCTASTVIPDQYGRIFDAGMHIVTPNKCANSQSLDSYRKLRVSANTAQRLFLYSTNVGAGLPAIDMLQNSIRSGDKLLSFTGILSGSLSYILGCLDTGIPFSTAVMQARSRHFMEPDPRNDLAGVDAARKILIIAREAGCTVELTDVLLTPILPTDFDLSGSVDEFMQHLTSIDALFAERVAALKKQNKVLRHVAAINSDGTCSVGIQEIDSSDPLFSVANGENAFVYTTRRYSPVPLVIRGYGAGADVTAAGIFADILRTVTWNT